MLGKNKLRMIQKLKSIIIYLISTSLVFMFLFVVSYQETQVASFTHLGFGFPLSFYKWENCSISFNFLYFSIDLIFAMLISITLIYFIRKKIQPTPYN